MGGVAQPIGSVLGIGPGEGEYFNAQTGNKALGQLDNRNSATGDYNAADNRGLYARGLMSSEDALNQARNASYAGNAGYLDQLQNDFATSALTGTKYATEQVQNNPILGQLFGNGGAFDRANQEEQNLSKNGFGLQQADHEAYGQASGDIARQFGQQEQSLAQALASRGLSQGDNGATAIGFSGLAGNKNEQLAKAQTDIAQKRMQSNLDRLGQTRTYLSQLGNQANTAINNQYQRALAGAGQAQTNLRGTAEATTQNNSINNLGLMAQQTSKEDNKVKTIGDAAAAGTYSGVETGAGKGATSLLGGSSGGGGAGASGGGKGTSSAPPIAAVAAA